MSLELVHELTAAQEEALWHLFQEEWWTAGRDLADVRAALTGSDQVYALTEPSGDLAGFARVVTDGVYKAFVLDVVVAARWRGQGLGRRLMDAMLADPELAGVKHFELYCKGEMAAFYEQWGFTSDLGDLLLMRRVR